MEPLAQDYVVVAQSPDKNSVYAGSPALARLSGGEVVATYEWFRPAPHKESIPYQTEVKVSTETDYDFVYMSRILKLAPLRKPCCKLT